MWVIDQDPPPFARNPSEKAYVDLLLKPSEDDLKIWPNRSGKKCILYMFFQNQHFNCLNLDIRKTWIS